MTRARGKSKGRLHRGSGRESWTKRGSTANQFYRRALDGTCLYECPFDITMDGLQHVAGHRVGDRQFRKRAASAAGPTDLGLDGTPETQRPSEPAMTSRQSVLQVCNHGVRTFEGGT